MTASSILTRLNHALKDILFPLFCLICNTEGTLLCDDCLVQVPPKGVFRCPCGNANTFQGKKCSECEGKSFLDSETALIEYQDHSPFAKLLHALKYNYIEESLLPLQSIFHSFFVKNSFIFENMDGIQAVPLHPRRFAERGFNQCEKIATFIHQETQLPLLHVLKRISFTQPQVGLSHEQRQKNVHNAFVLTSSVQGKKIMLIDDVYTTGSTLQECARALKENGATEVHGFTLARAGAE